MIMKHTAYILSILAAAAVSAACAKVVLETSNESAKRFYDSYVEVHYGDGLTPVGNCGAYILEDSVGSGECVDGFDVIFAHYTKYDLDGNITSTTVADTAKKIRSWSESAFYGPRVMIKKDMYAGIEHAFSGMKVGGKRRVIIPKWLMTYNRYETYEEYFKKTNEEEHCIIDVTVTGVAEDIDKWELDSLKNCLDRFIAERNIPEESIDTIDAGLYLIRLKETEKDTTVWAADTTFKVNYTGRLLNGQVFDTTVKDTAKVYHLYNESKSYSPSTVSWKTEASEITLGGSSTIVGFNQALSCIRRGETVVAMFVSGFGYGASGSGSSIPAYSPLSFEIEMVKE